MAKKSPPPPKQSRLASMRERVMGLVAVLFVVAFVATGITVLLVVTHTGFTTLDVPLDAMEPTLHGCPTCSSDRIVARSVFPRVERGDIVVLHPPDASLGPKVHRLVLRALAGPGDTIEARGDTLWVAHDGASAQPIDEPYVNPQCRSARLVTKGVVALRVPAHHWYVLGDNRCGAVDSRAFGPVDESLLDGVVIARVWPLTSISTF